MISYLTNGFLKHASKKELYAALEDVCQRVDKAIWDMLEMAEKEQDLLAEVYKSKAHKLLTEADCIAGAIVKK